jgi:hypothetical protein
MAVFLRGNTFTSSLAEQFQNVKQQLYIKPEGEATSTPERRIIWF